MSLSSLATACAFETVISLSANPTNPFLLNLWLTLKKKKKGVSESALKFLGVKWKGIIVIKRFPWELHSDKKKKVMFSCAQPVPTFAAVRCVSDSLSGKGRGGEILQSLRQSPYPTWVTVWKWGKQWGGQFVQGWGRQRGKVEGNMSTNTVFFLL